MPYRSKEADRTWRARNYLKNKGRLKLQHQHWRRANVAKTVLMDSRKADRKNGRENDLDLGFVRGFVEGACTYCGETELRMTLDRIDNTLGHLKSNVVGACERCNYARRDMPYAAWLVVAKAMREARDAGLFGVWSGGIHRRNVLAQVPPRPFEVAAHGTLGGYHKCGPPRCEACRRAMREWKSERRRLQKLPSYVSGETAPLSTE